MSCYLRTPFRPAISAHTHQRDQCACLMRCAYLCSITYAQEQGIVPGTPRTFASTCVCIVTGIIHNAPAQTHTQQTFHAQSMSAANHTHTHTLTHLFAKEELRGNHILKAATMTTSTISRPECLCICLYANV